MIATGLLVLGGALALHQTGFVWIATVPLGLFGLGALLIGIFPGN